jgi:hypothetical protein
MQGCSYFCSTLTGPFEVVSLMICGLPPNSIRR